VPDGEIPKVSDLNSDEGQIMALKDVEAD